jgi:hypothetical protein
LTVKVMAEGNDTPDGERGRTSPRGEGDLLAERRARRAAESGEVALTRRAEAAEATVQTLERHVASLQQRLREAEDAQRQIAERLEAEKSGAREREHELRRVKQREYAEQQLRVETEERLGEIDRESGAEIARIGARLNESEAEARELGGRLEGVERQLAEAEQGTAAERAAVGRSETELQARMAELERRASELQRGLDRERAARERSEDLLEGMRQGYGQLGGLLGEVRGIVVRLLAAAEGARPAQAPIWPEAAGAPPPRSVRAESPRAPLHPAPAEFSARSTAYPATRGAPPDQADPQPSAASEARGAEMADALAAAVERLRARAEAAPEPAEAPPAPTSPRIERAPHKHSMSLIKRVRIWRKQRRSR